MADFLQKHPVDFDYSKNGKLHLYTSQAQVDTARAFAATLEKYGIYQEILTPAQCLAREPALQDRKGTLAGGMFSPADEVGDCRKFAQALIPFYSTNVTVKTGVSVRAIRTEKGAFKGVALHSGEMITADACLVAAGFESHAILRDAGVRIPLYPVKGYSATLDNADINLKINITDHLRRVVFAPVGNTLRIAGFMHFSGSDRRITPATHDYFKTLIKDVFPRAQLPRHAGSRRGISALYTAKHTGHGPHADQGTLRQYRPCHAGLDAGARHVQERCGRDFILASASRDRPARR